MAVLKILLYGKEVATLSLEPGQIYTLGRSEDCSYQLADRPGISRNHFQISDATGTWTAEIVSKFGELLYEGQPVSSITLEDQTAFKLADYDFHFIQNATQATAQRTAHGTAAVPTSASFNNELPAAVGAEGFSSGHGDANSPPDEGNEQIQHKPSGTLSLVPSPQSPAPIQFDGNDDATNVGVILPGRPFLRLIKSHGEESTVELDGKKWIAGREETCDIFLPDRKASRRQFEITSTPEGYFITDLGSANGTVLNGDPLIPEDPRIIRSGDIITINSLKIYFEIRDPNFEKRLVAIPKEMMVAPSMVPMPQFEIINYPIPASGDGGGAVRVDGLYGAGAAADKRKKTIRLAAILLIIIGGLYAAFGDSNSDSGKINNSAEKNLGITRLPPKQQQMVKDIYVSARNLYMQGKFELAGDQLKRLHEILPEGYEGSKAMEEDCLAQRANAEQLAFVEQERKRVEEQKRMIDRNIRECKPLANKSMNIDEVRNCLAPSIGLDPTNALVTDLISRTEQRVMARDQQLAAQKDYAQRVQKGLSLFQHAQSLQAKSSWYPAIDAYNKHISSSYPDPNQLKTKSKAAIKKIKNMLAARVEEYLMAAENAYQAKNLKDALIAAQKAKEFDPKSERAAEYIGRLRKELNGQLRNVYEDAILYEGVGRIQEAQTKWRQIMDRDTQDGDYYQKARIKLKNYADQGP